MRFRLQRCARHNTSEFLLTSISLLSSPSPKERKTEQNKTEQNRTKQNKTEQNRTRKTRHLVSTAFPRQKFVSPDYSRTIPNFWPTTPYIVHIVQRKVDIHVRISYTMLQYNFLDAQTLSTSGRGVMGYEIFDFQNNRRLRFAGINVGLEWRQGFKLCPDFSPACLASLFK
jgi:hypothetical protein